MMIDVIIPAYLPSEKYLFYLNRALKSLENQSYKDFNVILVLNGLYTDKTKIIKSINYSKNINILYMDGKQSAAKARNFGIKNATSKYIAQLDADDQYMPEKLSKQINFLQSNLDYSLVGTLAYDLIDNQYIQDSFAKIGQYETHDQISKELPTQNIICCGSVMFNSKIFKESNLFYEERYKPGSFWPSYNKNMHEDWDLWLRIVNYGYKIYNLQERLYIWSNGTSVER